MNCFNKQPTSYSVVRVTNYTSLYKNAFVRESILKSLYAIYLALLNKRSILAVVVMNAQNRYSVLPTFCRNSFLNKY